MMKKILIILLPAFLSCITVAAQDVLNEIVRTSLATVNDTTLDINLRKTAVFKYDALNYMRSKVLQPAELLGDSIDLNQVNAKIKMLNEQALAMNNYVNLYFKRLSDTKKKNRAMVAYYFKQATIDHPLFNDTDTETTRAYFNRDDYPVQFCIDCDWEASLDFIRKQDWSDK